jgi:hypothetical protein
MGNGLRRELVFLSLPMTSWLSYSDAVSFRDIRGHLGTIPSIVTFYLYAFVVEGDYSRVTRRNPGE